MEAGTRSGRRGFADLAVGRLAVEGSLVVLVAATEGSRSLAAGLVRRKTVGCRRASRNVRWLALEGRNSADGHRRVHDLEEVRKGRKLLLASVCVAVAAARQTAEP